MADLTPEALAGELEEDIRKLRAMAATDDKKGRDTSALAYRQQAKGVEDAIAAIRDRLAPAHAALFAERDKLAGRLEELGEQLGGALADGERYRAALEAIRDATALGDVITRDGIHVHVIAREALEGGHG